jgi:hypothetical protein
MPWAFVVQTDSEPDLRSGLVKPTSPLSAPALVRTNGRLADRREDAGQGAWV